MTVQGEIHQPNEASRATEIAAKTSTHAINEVLSTWRKPPPQDGKLEPHLKPINVGADRTFADAVEKAENMLPNDLKQVMFNYDIYTVKIGDQFLYEMSQHPGKKVDFDNQEAVREHIAGTDPEHHTQYFAEWERGQMDPKTGRFEMHDFPSAYDLLGTVAHEAEHALDVKLGRPSQNDPDFDNAYDQDALTIAKEFGDAKHMGYLTGFVHLDPRTNSPIMKEVGKSELFAELGAIVKTGHSSSLIPPEELVSFFPNSYRYVYDKVQSGQW